MSSAFEFQDLEDAFDLHFVLKIEICVEFLFTLIGNCLSLVVINFEQYGGDPMKRGLENKLISSFCMAQIVGMFSSASVSMVRALFGPISVGLATLAWFIMITSNHFASLLIMLIFSNKNLNILAFNFVSHLDEGFWFSFSQFFGLISSIVLTFVMYVLNEGSLPVINAFAGLPIDQTSFSMVPFTLMVLGAFVMFLSHFIISIYKAIQEHNEQGESQVETPNLFNNLVHNPNVLSDLQILLPLTGFVVTGMIPLLVNQGRPPETVNEAFWYWLPGRWVLGFFNPALFFYFNPAIGAHFKRDFWDDWAPEWMQKYNPYLIPLDNPPAQQGAAPVSHESVVNSDPAQPKSRLIFVEPAEQTPTPNEG